MPVRVPVAVLALVVGLTIGIVALLVSSESASPGAVAVPGAPVPPAPSADRRALEVLRAWDERRADAWAAGDTEALAALYASGSAAGAADVTLLRRYLHRGLVVRGLKMQVLRARVLRSRPRVVVLEVTDRVASAVAVRSDDPRAGRLLPVDGASTRRLVLRRVAGRWVMVRVDRATGSAR